MSRKLILSALFLLFTNFTYAEEQQANFLVIEGNNRVSSEEITEYSGFQVGKIYNNDEIVKKKKKKKKTTKQDGWGHASSY